MTDWAGALARGYSVSLADTLSSMQQAEAAGRIRDAGRYAEQAATLIAELRLIRLAGQATPLAPDLPGLAG